MKKDLHLSELEAQSALELPNRDLFFLEQFGLANLFVPINLALNVCPQVNVAVLAAYTQQENLCVSMAEQALGND